MDVVDLNNSPDLTMDQITKQLFNNEFLSDIQFSVEGKVLFAHSWELMKRSIVFRGQFKGNLGENKLMPIKDTSYKAFYEFLRFIYTDEFDTQNDELRCEILKLAVKYKIVKLENQVLQMSCGLQADLKFFEFSVVNKYELCHNVLLDHLIANLNYVVRMETFLNIDSNVVEIILKSDQIASGMSEIKLFNGLVGWMNKSCEINQTPLSQRRTLFDKLLRLIRFPVMTSDEFRLCVKDHPDLFTSEDNAIICQQIILGPQYENQKWISNPRLTYLPPYNRSSCPTNSKRISKFTVSRNLHLYGLRYGYCYPATNIEIQISGINCTTNDPDVLSFTFVKPKKIFNMISLGDSIKLKPNVEYTVEIIFKANNVNRAAFTNRWPDTNLIVTGPSDLVTFTEISDNLFEIFFKLPVVNV